MLGTTPAGYRAKWGLPADYPMEAVSAGTGVIVGVFFLS